jgi:hypothetical protein
MSCVPQTELGIADHWQVGFLAVLPAVQTHAKIRFRHLRADRREEAIQEAIAFACVSYQRLVYQGKLEALRASTLAEFAVRRVRGGRFAACRQHSQDVLGPSAHQRHGFDVRSLTPSREDQDGWQATLIECRRVLPSDMAAFRIDLEQWLRSFTPRTRRIITTLASGERTAAVAEQFGLTAGRVSQLRRRYERHWLAFQGEGPLMVRVRQSKATSFSPPKRSRTARRASKSGHPHVLIPSKLTFPIIRKVVVHGDGSAGERADDHGRATRV